MEIEQMQAMLKNPSEFQKWFNKNIQKEEFGKGYWKQDDKQGYRLAFPDGSVVRIQFFNTVKKLYTPYNIEIPGRESFLSYMYVTVKPADAKAYDFRSFVAQHVKAPAPGKQPAIKLHTASIEKLLAKAESIGITLSDADWVTRFERFAF